MNRGAALPPQVEPQVHRHAAGEEAKPPAFIGNSGPRCCCTKEEALPMLHILCAAGGLRLGEAWDRHQKHIPPDCSTIKSSEGMAE